MSKTKLKATFAKSNKPAKRYKDQVKFGNGKSVPSQQVSDFLEMVRIMDQFKMIIYYALRNEGWGATRLERLNDKFNEYFIDIGTGLFSLEDIEGVLLEECGLTKEGLMLQVKGGIR